MWLNFNVLLPAQKFKLKRSKVGQFGVPNYHIIRLHNPGEQFWFRAHAKSAKVMRIWRIPRAATGSAIAGEGRHRGPPQGARQVVSRYIVGRCDVATPGHCQQRQRS